MTSVTGVAAPRFVDLHMHSNHSDGTESPAEVMRQAHAHGVRTADPAALTALVADALSADRPTLVHLDARH